MINMSAKIDVRGVIKQLADIKDKQLPFAMSLAINRTAQKVREREQHEIRDVFDRPTPFIQNSIFIKPSNKLNLTATVGIKDNGFGKGIPAIKPLEAEIVGGARRLKRYEVALRSIGVLPSGYVTVPGEGAEIDSFGNMKASQIRQLLSYFRANRDVGSISNSTDATRAKLARGTKKRAGISYFVGKPGDAPLGIWRRTTPGALFTGPSKPLMPILIFVQSARYEAIYDFDFVARQTIEREFDGQFIRAWSEAEATRK